MTPRSRAAMIVSWPVVAVVHVILVISFAWMIQFPPDYVPAQAPSVEHVRVNDFAFMLNYTRYHLANRGTSVYGVDAHKRFHAEWFGEEQDWAMAYGWSPTAALMLAPLTLLPTPWAWALFVLVTAAILFAALLRVDDHQSRVMRFAWMGLLSPVALFTIAQGQTSFLTAGLFLWSYDLVSGTGASARKRREHLVALVLLLLTFKPPLALVLGAALLASGWVRPVVHAAVGVVLIALAATWWSGPGWVSDYLALIAQYDLDSADPVFLKGFAPELMTNFRNLVYAYGAFSDDLAMSVSTALFGVALAAGPVLTLVRRRALPPLLAFVLAAFAHLLFTPQLTPSEDVLVVALLAMLAPRLEPDSRVERATVWAAMAVLLLGGGFVWLVGRVQPQLVQLLTLIPVAFVAKIALGATALRTVRAMPR